MAKKGVVKAAVAVEEVVPPVVVVDSLRGHIQLKVLGKLYDAKYSMGAFRALADNSLQVLGKKHSMESLLGLDIDEVRVPLTYFAIKRCVPEAPISVAVVQDAFDDFLQGEFLMVRLAIAGAIQGKKPEELLLILAEAVLKESEEKQ